MRGGDIIVAMDDVSAQSVDDLGVSLANEEVGQRIMPTILGNDTEREVQVVLEEMPTR